MSIQIVLADDHQVLVEGLKSIIELEEDMEVIGVATDGQQAVSVVEEKKPDLVIMDINMPEMDGVEATREIKKRSPQTEVLILSMFDKEEYLFPVIRAGAGGYLLKDSYSAEVVEAIRVVANGQSMLHPAMAKKLINEYSTQDSFAYRQSAATIQPSFAPPNLEEESNEQQSGSFRKKDRRQLSPREKDVLALLVNGKSNREIAHSLYISEKTVKIHLNKIYKKLQVKSRSQAIIHTIQNNLLNSFAPRGWETGPAKQPE